MSFPLGTPYAGSAPSTAYAGTFIPEVWSGKLVEKFYKATVLGAVANTDYEGEIKNYGDKVQIRSRPDVTIADYSANMELAVTRPSVAKQTMNIDKGKYFNLALDDVMEVQSDIDQLSIWAEDAAEQMKINIDNDVLNTGLVGNSAAANMGLTAGAISSSYRIGTAAAPAYVNKVATGTGDGDRRRTIALSSTSSSTVARCSMSRTFRKVAAGWSSRLGLLVSSSSLTSRTRRCLVTARRSCATVASA